MTEERCWFFVSGSEITYRRCPKTSRTLDRVVLLECPTQSGALKGTKGLWAGCPEDFWLEKVESF
jgi:hypothetical protein